MRSAPRRGPPSGGRVVVWALLGVLFLNAAPALAQDGETPPPGSKPAEGLGEGGEVTEEMLRACPDLKGAVGRKKEQLVALYSGLDWRKAGEEATRKRVKELFDLTKDEDTAVLEKQLQPTKGPQRCANGLRCVFAASGPEGLLFALERWTKVAVEARGRWLDALAAVPYREVDRFLAGRLTDKASVPNWRASQEGPPGYADLRVCDYAFRTIIPRLFDIEGLTLPKEVAEGQLASITKMDERDKKVAALAEWLAKDKAYAAHLAKQPSVLAAPGLDEATKKRLGEALEKHGARGE